MIDYVDKVLKGWEWSLLIYKWLLSLCKWYLGYRSNKYDLVHRLNNGFLQLFVGVKNDLCYKLVHKIIFNWASMYKEKQNCHLFLTFLTTRCWRGWVRRWRLSRWTSRG